MRVRFTASFVLILAGIIFAAIYAWWALVPLLFEKPLQVTWSDEATYYYGNYTSEIFDAVGGAVETSYYWTEDFAGRLANQTDLIVDIIDVRLGMAWVWWELSNGVDDPTNAIFSGRWTWDRWTPEQLGTSFTPQACYDRLKEAEVMAVDKGKIPSDWLQVDWSFEAAMYYWNPGEPVYEVSDQPDMITIFDKEAEGNTTTEFRAMFANATIKAEEMAKAANKDVDLAGLREAIVITLQQQYPERYPDLTAAQIRLEELEAEAGLP